VYAKKQVVMIFVSTEDTRKPRGGFGRQNLRLRCKTEDQDTLALALFIFWFSSQNETKRG